MPGGEHKRGHLVADEARVMRAGDRESPREYLEGVQKGLSGPQWVKTLARRSAEAKAVYHKGTKGTKKAGGALAGRRTA